jgi:hypothetical protein
MNAVLGGLFNSRINLNLREVHGYTYGAFSSIEWRREAGPFVVSTAVKSDITDAACARSSARSIGFAPRRLRRRNCHSRPALPRGSFPHPIRDDVRHRRCAGRVGRPRAARRLLR